MPFRRQKFWIFRYLKHSLSRTFLLVPWEFKMVDVHCTLIFWKFCFNIGTSYKELIWCTKCPNVHVHTFRTSWSFIWAYFNSVSILNPPIWLILEENLSWEIYLYMTCKVTCVSKIIHDDMHGSAAEMEINFFFLLKMSIYLSYTSFYIFKNIRELL